MKFVLLAAGKSKRLYKKIGIHKCLLNIGNNTLIQNTINEIYKSKIKNITIILGFKAKEIKSHLKKYKNVNYIINKDYNTKEMLHSLMLALKKNNTNIIFGYSDVIINNKTIRKLINLNKGNITVPILKNWKKIWKIRNKDPLKDAETLFVDRSSKIISIGNKIKKIKDIKYQFMGLIFIPKNERKNVLKFYNNLKKKINFI